MCTRLKPNCKPFNITLFQCLCRLVTSPFPSLFIINRALNHSHSFGWSMFCPTIYYSLLKCFQKLYAETESPKLACEQAHLGVTHEQRSRENEPVSKASRRGPPARFASRLVRLARMIQRQACLQASPKFSQELKRVHIK